MILYPFSLCIMSKNNIFNNTNCCFCKNEFIFSVYANYFNAPQQSCVINRYSIKACDISIPNKVIEFIDINDRRIKHLNHAIKKTLLFI